MPTDKEPSSRPSYVLITPARNEAEFIESTVRSLIAQTHKPLRWFVVSDGSTDGTDDIVKKYLGDNPWIELVRRPERAERHFAGKVMAFNEGYERAKGMDYDVIGNLDADITVDSEYFAFLMDKFVETPQLGVAGTPFRDEGVEYNYNFSSIEYVSGACQMFRRKCFDDIGGYVPIKGGGIDIVAVTTARMKGWKTRTFPEKVCIHHRPMGTSGQGKLKFAFKGGGRDYAMGMHPLWEFLRSAYQMTRKPYIVGGCCVLAGYLWATATMRQRPISSELVAFRRKEQMLRLRQFARKLLPWRSASDASGLGSP